jgi:hypothetical protein
MIRINGGIADKTLGDPIRSDPGNLRWLFCILIMAGGGHEEKPVLLPPHWHFVNTHTLDDTLVSFGDPIRQLNRNIPGLFRVLLRQGGLLEEKRADLVGIFIHALIHLPE